MKNKKSEKKLVLKKETISILTIKDLNAIQGGISEYRTRCAAVSMCFTCEAFGQGIIC